MATSRGHVVAPADGAMSAPTTSELSATAPPFIFSIAQQQQPTGAAPSSDIRPGDNSEGRPNTSIMS